MITSLKVYGLVPRMVQLFGHKASMLMHDRIPGIHSYAWCITYGPCIGPMHGSNITTPFIGQYADA